MSDTAAPVHTTDPTEEVTRESRVEEMEIAAESTPVVADTPAKRGYGGAPWGHYLLLVLSIITYGLILAFSAVAVHYANDNGGGISCCGVLDCDWYGIEELYVTSKNNGKYQLCDVDTDSTYRIDMCAQSLAAAMTSNCSVQVANGTQQSAVDFCGGGEFDPSLAKSAAAIGLTLSSLYFIQCIFVVIRIRNFRNMVGQIGYHAINGINFCLGIACIAVAASFVEEQMDRDVARAELNGNLLTYVGCGPRVNGLQMQHVLSIHEEIGFSLYALIVTVVVAAVYPMMRFGMELCI